MATQALIQRRPKTMRVKFEGKRSLGVTAKDLILALIGHVGAAGGTGYAVEYAGSAIREISVEGRLTICNLPIELGAKIGMVAPDEKTSLYYCITAVNSIPRIALAPIIVLAFGIGDMSKIVTSWIVVVFLVFFNTFEGARSIDEGFVSAARLLGASEWQITRTVVMPSTMAWVFASLSPAISFALIGVIVGEFIGAERGIGRLIIESEARAEASA